MIAGLGVNFGVGVFRVDNVGGAGAHPVASPTFVRVESEKILGISRHQGNRLKTASICPASRSSEAGCLPLCAFRGNGRLGSVEERLPSTTPKPSPRGQESGCLRCGDEGAVVCPTCTGSGLYVDSILESQGIIVKVKCIGCGGNGYTLCPECGGKTSTPTQ